MLLTITYQEKNAADLGYLLHKNPNRPQKFELSYGHAYVFYPEASDDCCTAALLLDIDPIDLARGKEGTKSGGLFDYVNDRPYVSSSFMSTAIASVFGTALAGRCDKKPELASSEHNLKAAITALPCRGEVEMIDRIFSPLGYEVRYTKEPLDEKFPEWGEGCYVNLSLSNRCLLKDLLSHLYVLIPVFDRRKHYWIGADEIDKLLRKGAGWLENHPERDFIVKRYLAGRKRLARMAAELLDNGESGATEEADLESPERETPEETAVKKSLNTRRLEAVVAALLSKGASTVIDLGCGEGNLLRLLLREKSFARVAGADASAYALERAERRLKAGQLEVKKTPEDRPSRLALFQGALTYRDERFSGYDAATCVEVIEHIDKNRLGAFEDVLFAHARPRIVVITTPNIEYNEKFEKMSGPLRHKDHRFEWTREEFHAWGSAVANRNGYEVAFSLVGDADEKLGTQTQMGVFAKCV
ncbi:MAG: 3' terminal RNA ribose 2'-O-methyltransferase Hen1 [Synergistaceae bacterium]|jgi:3' terminal RNA ribose 2'-O-methyltransferase Hen1|nr:3' terminal RNA ribose 2'-O-methyltransferase Hen1 [Synergistaceae bacterium]